MRTCQKALTSANCSMNYKKVPLVRKPLFVFKLICTLYWMTNIPAKYIGSSFSRMLNFALRMFPSLAPPVVFRRVMVKFSVFSGICIKQKKYLNYRYASPLNMSTYLWYYELLKLTSSGIENRVRFFRYSPSAKMISPCTGLISPE